jgi:hypothetical protein
MKLATIKEYEKYGEKAMRKPMIIAFMLIAVLFTAVSAFALADDSVVSFEVSPNPMDKHCTISLSFLNPLNISLQIQTQEGDVIKDIYSGYAGKNTTYRWDRLDDCGNYVPEGKYFVVLGYDQRYTSTKKTLILK